SWRGRRVTRPPIASSRAASAAPHRSTATLSVVGDSIATSDSVVSRTQSLLARQKSRRFIIVDMILTRTLCVLCSLCVLGFVGVEAQQPPTPQPFPRPGPTTSQPAGRGAQPPPTQPGTPARPAEAVPTEAMLGVPIFPGAQFIASYDAGRGQRYYIFGSPAGFVDLVSYYRTVLKQKGELVYDVPATHEFDVCKFNEDTMTFAPSVD